MVPRRRRVRALGGREPTLPPSRRRQRARRLVGDGRTQVAQRPLRLRRRLLRRSGRTAGGDELHRRLPRAGGRVGGAGADGVHARVLASGPSRPGLRGRPLARCERRRRARGALLRRGRPARRSPRRDPGVHRPERRRAQPGARALRRGRGHHRCPRRPAGGRGGLDERHAVGRASCDPLLGLELAHDARRHRAHGRRAAARGCVGLVVSRRRRSRRRVRRARRRRRGRRAWWCRRGGGSRPHRAGGGA